MNDKEINALIRLLDDSDREVFEHVESKLLALGEAVVKPLEAAWENSFEPILQHRIEELIHKIQFRSVSESLQLWKLSGSFDLLQGLLIINRYQYPDLDEQKIINEIEAIKREAWMQLMYDMSAVEKVRLLNHVFYNSFGFSGNTKNYHDAHNSYLSDVLSTRKGNPILLSAIYSIVAQKLDIPVYGVNLPQHFILGYTDSHAQENEVLFYINAFNRGQIFGRHEVLTFLRQLSLPAHPDFFKPCTTLEIVQRVLRNLIGAYQKAGAHAKMEEVSELLEILESDR